MFDFSIVTHWIDNLLRSVMPGWGALLVEFCIGRRGAAAVVCSFGIVLYIF